METIYKITSPSGRIYIGRTKDIKKRIYYYKKNHCKTQSLLYKSILKHGWENHSFEEIEKTENGFKDEQKWIKHFKSNIKRFPLNNGLNLSDGGEGNSGGCIIRVYEYDIHGNYMREWDSQEEAVKHYKKTSNHIPQVCKGIQKTFAERRWSYMKLDKLEDLKGAKKKSKKYNDIKQIDINTGKIINVWQNVSEITLNNPDYKCQSCIIDCINKKQKTYKNFIWTI